MGTRIDFWIGTGAGAEWIGSIGMDGYVESVPDLVREAGDAEDFRHHVGVHLRKERDEGGAVAFRVDGWQWPWEDSRISDHSVWFSNGIVYFESGDWLVLFSQYDTWANAEEDGATGAPDVPGAFRPDWDAMPNMLESERALYGKTRKSARDVGAGPVIIAAR